MGIWGRLDQTFLDDKANQVLLSASLLEQSNVWNYSQKPVQLYVWEVLASSCSLLNVGIKTNTEPILGIHNNNDTWRILLIRFEFFGFTGIGLLHRRVWGQHPLKETVDYIILQFPHQEPISWKTYQLWSTFLCCLMALTGLSWYSFLRRKNYCLK